MATLTKEGEPTTPKPVDLTGAHLLGMDLSGAHLAGSKFATANLADMNFEGAVLRNSVLRNANLSGANLTGADLTGADLEGARCTGATLTQATVDRANFARADLRDARVEGVDFSMALGLTWHQMLDASFDANTIPPKNLKIEALVDELTRADPSVSWQQELEGDSRSIMSVLAFLRSKGPSGSLLSALHLVRAERELREKDSQQ